MMGEMKPCPFCGSAPKLVKPTDPTGFNEVHCTGCDAYQETPELWNRRTPPTTQGAGDWVLVPRTLPEAMNKAARATVPYDALCEADMEDLWAAALSAAPPAPASDHVGEGEALKAAYREGWNDREADFLVGVDRLGAPSPDHAALVGEIEADIETILRDTLTIQCGTEDGYQIHTITGFVEAAGFIRARLAAALHPSAEGDKDKC